MCKGFILLSRRITESAIFHKPSDWLKIWIYILNTVNFKDGFFKRGENLFNMNEIAMACGTSYNTVDKFLQWARKSEMLATRKTTRGIVISVLQYATYQDPDFYKSDTKGEIEAKQKRNRSDTIREEGKNVIKKERTSVRTETETLYKTIQKACDDYGLVNSVNINALDVYVERYIGKIRLGVEFKSCLAWLIDKNLKNVTTQRIGNWFKKALEIQKRDELKNLEWRASQNDPVHKTKMKNNFTQQELKSLQSSLEQ